MQIMEITVVAGRTFNHPFEQYSNLRPSVTLKAALGPEDDPIQSVNKLQAMAEKAVEDHKQGLLQSLEELHELTERQREMTSLAEQLTRAQSRLDAIRAQHSQLSLSGLTPADEGLRASATEIFNIGSDGLAYGEDEKVPG